MEERNDIGIKHLAHEHLLILNETYIAKEGDICQGCREQIDSCKSFVYGCSNITSTTSTSTGGVENLCVKFLLHKTCAELPPTIVNPTDPKVSLVFHSIPELSRLVTYINAPPEWWDCRVCRSPWRWFSYCNSINEWEYVCFKCALFQVHQSKEDPTLFHPGHTHPLALVQHPSSFKCYACRVDDNIRDMSYRCTKCQFWMHKRCGDAPASFRFQFHDRHPLTLSFSLPQAYRTFSQHCRLCNKTLNCLEWLYCCNSCRFFTHFRCARSRSSSSSEHETYPNMVHLPAADELSLNLLLEQFMKDKIIQIIQSNSYNNNSSIYSATNYVKHWAHVEHDLKLITISELYDEKNDDEISLLCECCVKPIQTCDDTLFYGCVPCKYFMHKVCAEFPREVEHHLWPGKTLRAHKYCEPFQLFFCDCCQNLGNGIFFSTEDKGDIFLDIGCVSLPKVIKHEAHHHQLDQVFCGGKCDACEWYYIKCIKYTCEKCNFSICGRCIIRHARTYKHRWDAHPLELRYDAGMVEEEHEHEFDCEYCSNEINTNYWFYHCSISTCDLSFHSHCIRDSSYRGYPYIKLAATDMIIDKLHPHSLTFVLNKKVRSCEKCGNPCRGEPVLQCATCNVIFCVVCCYQLSKSTDFPYF